MSFFLRQADVVARLLLHAGQPVILAARKVDYNCPARLNRRRRLKPAHLSSQVTFLPTVHPDIYHLDSQDELQGEPLRSAVNELGRLALEGDASSIVRLLDELIPGSEVRCTPPPELTSID